MDRVISVECPVIDTRQSSSQQWQAFDRALPNAGRTVRPGGGCAARTAQCEPAREDRPRLVEYVLLGMALAKASGTHPDEFLQQFKTTRAETVARTLDASPVAAAILEFIEANPYGIEASVKDILTRLESHKPLGAEAWPRTPKGLGDALRRASPALRQMGVECKSLGNIGGKVKWSIKRKQPTPSHESHEVMHPADSEHDIKTCMTWQTSFFGCGGGTVSDATILIRAALDAGVHLKFEDGKIKACGRTDVVSLWAPVCATQSRTTQSPGTGRTSGEPRRLERAGCCYHAHHFRCAVCAAAGRGARYGPRCGAGAALWSAYNAATEPKETKNDLRLTSPCRAYGTNTPAAALSKKTLHRLGMSRRRAAIRPSHFLKATP